MISEASNDILSLKVPKVSHNRKHSVDNIISFNDARLNSHSQGKSKKSEDTVGSVNSI